MESISSRFPIFTATLRPFLSGDTSPYTRLMYIWGTLAFIGTCTETLWGVFKTYFTSTIYVRCNDEVYKMILAWMTSRQLDHSTRSSLAQTKTKMRADGFEEQVESDRKLHFSPWESTFLFRHKFNWFSYQTSLRDRGFHKEEIISITCFGRSSDSLQNFLAECRQEYLEMLKNKTSIFQHRGNRWTRDTALNSRPLSTVILNRAEKEALINDVKGFLDPKTQEWYSCRSIPYRRGYLLHGPPGTGKTSLSLSVAGQFGLDMYYVNISDVSDNALRDLFSDLPHQCVVLLEDIDAAWSTQDRAPQPQDNAVDEDDMSMMMMPQQPKKSITLSGLLNVIDGVASQEGRVLIMTTNHIEKLDKALIRPGRVDRMIKFELADRYEIIQLFRFVFQELNTDGEHSDVPSSNDPALDEFAERFANLVPERELSPAEILSFLVRYRSSPTEMLDNLHVWLADTLQEKQKMLPPAEPKTEEILSNGI